MNIFKILASGNGTIKEPNVSAFLGYLLNPKEDHGLGDAFLKRFLEPLLYQNNQLDFMRNRNLSIRSNFEIEVLLEQAFKNNKKKEIVDIVILCYEKKSQQGMFLAEDIIKQKKEGAAIPKHIFLIENKIREGALRNEQLNEQYNRTIEKLKDMKFDMSKNPEDIVSVIFVTPEGENTKKEFDNFTETNKRTDNKYHLFWNKNNSDSTSSKKDISISSIIKDIIMEESHPIDAYCKYTLQAFLGFIESNFKSTIEEELEEKKDGNFRYDGEIYSRPRLAEKLIRDYLSANTNKTLAELDQEFKNITTGYKPFLEMKEAQDFNSNRVANWYYEKDPIEVADGHICVSNDWTDEDKIKKLITIVKPELKLDDIRVKPKK